MKKIIIIAVGILCILAFLIFMAQTCEQGGAGYPSYTGTWSDIMYETYGEQIKVELTLTENTWQMDFYDGPEPWSYLMGVKGTFTVSSDDFTMTVNGGRWMDSPYTAWYDWDNDPSNRFYQILSNYVIEGPYNYQSNFGSYATSLYSEYGTYPEIKGKWAISSTGNSIILHFSMWGANYFYDYAYSSYSYSWDPEQTPDQGWMFTKVE